jgi:hypothetical protein
LAREDFSVNITQISNTTVLKADNLVKQMNVIAVNDADKKITVMFGGAHSGEYKVDIRHKTFGLLETEGINLSVGSMVSSV